jgi:GNAT superfamily N-acetyltransferase
MNTDEPGFFIGVYPRSSAALALIGWICGTLELYPVFMADEWHRGKYVIGTDLARLDISMIHECLSGSAYWAMGRPLAVVRLSIENSLPFGVYKGSAQIGFARVVTDYATFAWLAGVFVLPKFQGQGIGKWLIGVIVDHPRLPGLRRWILATKDAHGLYAQYGFTPLHAPARFMERFAG